MSTFKIVYNTSYGGFSLNETALAELTLRKGLTGDDADDFNYTHDLPRDDKDLVAVVEGMNAGRDRGTELAIKTLPVRFRGCWRISEYDGIESVEVDPSLYRLKLIGEIVAGHLCDAEKLRQVAAVLREVVCVDYE